MLVNETGIKPKKGAAQSLHGAAWQGVLREKSLEEVFFGRFCLETWRTDYTPANTICVKQSEKSLRRALGISLTFQKRKRAGEDVKMRE